MCDFERRYPDGIPQEHYPCIEKHPTIEKSHLHLSSKSSKLEKENIVHAKNPRKKSTAKLKKNHSAV